MRTQGLVTEPVPVGPADHLCWVYEDATSFTAVAARFLAGGLTRGERLVYVGDEDTIDLLRSRPGPLGAVEQLEAAGTLTVLPLSQAYGRDGGFSPEDQLAFYDAATREALDGGAVGLRVVAELTGLAADPGRRSELVRWEHLADGFFAGGAGMSALCAYRRGALGDDVLREVAAVHPQARVPDGVQADELVPFRVFVDGDRLAVSGCVDAFGADRLRRLLTTSPVDRAEVAILDVGLLTFADAAGCRALAAWAQDRVTRGRRAELVGASPLFARVWRLLGYDRIAPVTTAGRAA
ncbi:MULTISPECIES: MEDS domain-containing protein [unclassified Geodermatophilus]|uniref:MEDS domain-containing protein n=1 Tax=unclassified Geodermatophilus TaxID=2637632 RepID=UPI003EECC5A6